MVIIMVLIGLIVLVICLIFLIQGAPFVRSSDADAEEIFRQVRKYKPKNVLDMGSGDGKLVAKLSGHGIRTDGIEINPILVWMARRTIKDVNLQDKATIFQGSFWNFDTSKYDLVTLYAIQHIMPRLEQKLASELKPGAIVISNYFTFPNIKPVLRKGRLNIYKF